MRTRIGRRIFIVTLTICFAMVLTILPVPEWLMWLRPQWVLLVVIYWCLAIPEHISVGIAWLIGLLLDVLSGTLLGQHALAFAVVAYFIVKFHPRIRVYPIWQKTFVVFILSLLYLGLLYWVQGLMGIMPQTWEYWSPAITSALLFPWVFIILRDLRRKFSIT